MQESVIDVFTKDIENQNTKEKAHGSVDELNKGGATEDIQFESNFSMDTSGCQSSNEHSDCSTEKVVDLDAVKSVKRGSSVDFRKLPSFPIDSLPRVLRDFVLAIAENTQSSPDLGAVTGLGVCSACLTGKAILYPKGENSTWKESSNLYIMVLANSGGGKSPVLGTLMSPIEQHVLDINNANKRRIAEYRAQVDIAVGSIESCKRAIAVAATTKESTRSNRLSIKEIKHNMEVATVDLINLQENPVCEREFSVTNATPEAFGDYLVENGGVGNIISSEGGIFEVFAGLYSGVPNLDVLLNAYDGGSLRIRRKYGKQSIDHTFASTNLVVQQTVLEEAKKVKAFVDRGLLARFLFAFPESMAGRRRAVTDEIPESLTQNYAALVVKLESLRLSDDMSKFFFSEDADLLWQREFMRIEAGYCDGENDGLEPDASKHLGKICRIALILHIVENVDELAKGDNPFLKTIGCDTLERAMEIGRYFWAHTKAALIGTREKEEFANYIIEKIKPAFMKNRTTILTTSKILDRCRKFKGKEHIEPYLSLLCEYDYLVENSGKSRKGSYSTYGAGPALHLDKSKRC